MTVSRLQAYCLVRLNVSCTRPSSTTSRLSKKARVVSVDTMRGTKVASHGLARYSSASFIKQLMTSGWYRKSSSFRRRSINFSTQERVSYPCSMEWHKSAQVSEKPISFFYSSYPPNIPMLASFATQFWDLCKRRAVTYARLDRLNWRFRRSDLDRYLEKHTRYAPRRCN